MIKEKSPVRHRTLYLKRCVNLYYWGCSSQRVAKAPLLFMSVLYKKRLSLPYNFITH
jgi:hypothetical protein